MVLCTILRGEIPGALYVGQAPRDPDWRFDDHKAGYKANAAVKRLDGDSFKVEAALANAFRDAGISWVEGGH